MKKKESALRVVFIKKKMRRKGNLYAEYRRCNSDEYLTLVSTMSSPSEKRSCIDDHWLFFMCTYCTVKSLAA